MQWKQQKAEKNLNFEVEGFEISFYPLARRIFSTDQDDVQ